MLLFDLKDNINVFRVVEDPLNKNECSNLNWYLNALIFNGLDFK
jgi:hypothetical protein